MEGFESRLTGGHPNSLGRTVEVVDEILKDPARFDELFNCYSSDDEVVRLRTSNAMKRICKANQSILLPYIDRFITQVAKLDQASAQWTLAQLFEMLEPELSPDQKKQAKKILISNVENHTDWIVLNETMKTAAKWAKSDNALHAAILPHLQRLTDDPRKSVSKTATKMLLQMEKYAS